MLAASVCVALLAAGVAADRLSHGSVPSGPQTFVSGAKRGHVEVLRLRRDGVSSDVWVYRPDVPDRAALPVIYFLHGLPGSASDVFRFGDVARILDRYLSAGGRPVVLAAPDGNSPRHSDTEWGNASDGSDELESFILRSVIPAVEGRHRRDRAHRAIIGFSMGGYGAMNIALQHPELFGQVVSLSGYFHLDDPSRMFATASSRHANDPDSNVERARGLRILLMDAEQDGLALTAQQSEDFHRRLAAAGIPSQLVLAPGTHSWAYVQSQLPAVLAFLAAGWPHGSA